MSTYKLMHKDTVCGTLIFDDDNGAIRTYKDANNNDVFDVSATQDQIGEKGARFTLRMVESRCAR